jgi:tetratricopeptide (TPR) repeat protein
VTDLLEAALDRPGQPVKRGTMAHDHHVLMQLAEAAAARRDAEGLARYVPRLAELAERDGHRLYQAVALRARGVAARLAGQPAEAEPLLRQALAIFGELETGWQAGRALAELGETALAAGDTAAARAHFSQALAAFEALGAQPDAERVRARLGELPQGHKDTKDN